MKNILLIAAVYFTSFAYAQQGQHRIVFDFTKADTASFATMMRQTRNILNAAGNVKLEIVCYGPGLDMLMTEKTTVQNEIKEFAEKFNVVFAACEASMQRRGIQRNQLLPQIVTVPLASLEISSKQQEGWSHLKGAYNP